MTSPPSDRSTPLQNLETDVALRAILEGTATETGQQFFAALVQNLAKALGTHGAWVTEYFPELRRLRALAFWMDGQWVTDYEVDIAGTPCERVIDTAKLVHFPDRILEIYPHEEELKAAGAVSYMGVPLQDTDGQVLGHMAVIDRRPIPEEPRVHAIFQIFAARAAAELQRMRAEVEVREREEKVGRLLSSAMDAIIELDDHLHITHVNPASEKTFRCRANEMIGQDFRCFVRPDDADRLLALTDELDKRPEGQRSMWIPGGLTARCPGGQSFPAEATLSRFELHRRKFTTLILRNIYDRVRAEETIQSLTTETELLREELQALHQDGALLGESPAFQRVLQDIAQVARTDATVLITGETGTGKELVARAIHAASTRRERPMVTVNCAAIPATLIESELFGHEAGAFTGATKKREGRFALADKGTIFLDEIGELPLELQAKLLRVLQEGEFDPVGSSRTRKVDVRVLAATNRDLPKLVSEGKFREDLFYRLNVFPLRLPPLRERGDDMVCLALVFTQRFAAKLGRSITPLNAEDIGRLKSYGWPGNVRELQNVVERVVITAINGRLNLERALPEPMAQPSLAGRIGEPVPGMICTAKELEELERSNILRALDATKWKVSGENGAAKLLGINASTLSSRMRAFKIQKPAVR
ncbi:MAG: sigma 54-interacting transcriptional regulator [Nitrospira sp.]|nr:sigma 54-interacting transcriptional regulator [Nitrospira sp.]MDH4342188.1 sigma 54-interacting transcriptional regulator [Nitrospira sp.]MDH5336202.1 sigma 54-interacting transcriptional regulator [Nitrospira sp.]